MDEVNKGTMQESTPAVTLSVGQLKALEKARTKAKNLSSQDLLKLQGQNGEKGASRRES